MAIAGGGRMTGAIGGMSASNVSAYRRTWQGLTVEGEEETRARLLEWGNVAVAVAGLTCRRVARMIIEQSLNHTPYHKGTLYYSAFGPGLKESGDAGAMTDTGTPDPEHGLSQSWIEGLIGGRMSAAVRWDDESDIETRVLSRITLANLATRTPTGLPIVKLNYAVGYTAEHAAYVHENARNVEFKQDTGPRSGHLKTSHFLKNAFDAHKDKLSKMTIASLQVLSSSFDLSVRPMKTVTVTTAAIPTLKPLAPPRLVKRT